MNISTSFNGVARVFMISVIGVICAAAGEVTKITPVEAAKKVTEGKAIIVDVREASEWAETGVAGPAVLLAKSDFDSGAADWKEFLKKNADKEIIVYCRSGARAGAVAAELAKKRKNIYNAGSFGEWKAAGLPVREVKAAE